MNVVVVGPKYSAKSTGPTFKILKIVKKLAFEATNRCENMSI